MRKTLLGVLAGALLAMGVMAENIALREGHPEEYVVAQGDTLWDISGRFLEKPWLWPQIWQANPQIANPDLIYPGDRITLVFVGGEPRLMLNRGAGGTVKNGAIEIQGDRVTAVREWFKSKKEPA